MPHSRMSPGEHEELHRQVEELVSKGHVHESISPCVVPAILTPKKDGSWRMCVDSRAINKIIVRYMFLILHLDDLLDQISGATIFTKLDLKSGYYQIRLRPGDEWKTAFKTRKGLYECAYFNEHVSHVTLLRKDSFYAAMKKCVFMTPKVLFLGYVVFGEGIQVDEFKVAAVQEWPTPTTITEVRSFHGLASFYSLFIPNFSSIMAPLTDCMKGKSFVWTEEAESAFQVVKEKLTTAPILVLHDFSKVFELHTDTSKVAIGGVLSQGGRLVAYFSEKLTEPKSRYTTYNLEFYVVIQAVKHWRHYLFHKEFVLFTDHDSLRHIRTQDKVSHKHGRWLAFLEKFTFVVKHKTSVSNRAADALSRRSNLLISMQVDVPGLDVIHAHNALAINRSTGFSPFQVVYSAQPRGPLDLMSLPVSGSVPKKVQDFVEGLHEVHKAVRDNLVRANSKYKQDADQKRRQVDFEVGDFVWAILTKDRFPVGEYNKLSAKKIGPLEIVEKINSNAYRLKLPSHIRCSDVFNVKHLLPYHGDSFDDDLVVNSRANFFYLGENDAGLSIEERAILFLEAQDRVKKGPLFKRS
ncbi:putative nucleotidyltransferase, ribonuclease H [Tanacetum coccineum]